MQKQLIHNKKRRLLERRLTKYKWKLQYFLNEGELNIIRRLMQAENFRAQKPVIDQI